MGEILSREEMEWMLANFTALRTNDPSVATAISAINAALHWQQRAEAAEQQCKAQSDALAEFREESVVLARLVNISGVLNASGTEKMREQARRVLELEKKL